MSYSRYRSGSRSGSGSMENILNPDPQQCPSGHYGATVVLVVDLAASENKNDKKTEAIGDIVQ